MICNARADCGSPYKSRLSHASFTPVARPRTTPHTTPPQARDCLDERGEGALSRRHRRFPACLGSDNPSYLSELPTIKRNGRCGQTPRSVLSGRYVDSPLEF